MALGDLGYLLRGVSGSQRRPYWCYSAYNYFYYPYDVLLTRWVRPGIQSEKTNE